MRLLPGTAALLVATLVCGCSHGPKLYPVSGAVTFDGAPVAEGDILFLPVDTALAPEPGTIKDGKYALQAREGKKRVEIRASKIQPGGAKGAGGEPVPEEYLPRIYNSESTLSAEVKSSGENKIDFPLAGK